MTYTCADIKFIAAIMRHILCISFFPSLLLWISHSRPQLPAIMISRSPSLPPFPFPVLLFVWVFFSFRYNGPKWKWKSAVLQSVSQLAKSPLKKNTQAEVLQKWGILFFHKSPRRVSRVFMYLLYTLLTKRSLMSVLVKYVHVGTWAWMDSVMWC